MPETRAGWALGAVLGLALLFPLGCAPPPVTPPPVPAGPDSAAAAASEAPPPPEAPNPPPPSDGSAQDRQGLSLFRQKPLAGCIFEPARDFVARYCADCHSSQGTYRLHERASRKLRLDSFEQWLADAEAMAGRLDLSNLKGHVMPPLGYPEQPTPEERKMMVDWLRRGSPNTPDGR